LVKIEKLEAVYGEVEEEGSERGQKPKTWTGWKLIPRKAIEFITLSPFDANSGLASTTACVCTGILAYNTSAPSTIPLGGIGCI
jgi:hypothetical protein